jgi:hypothetical protein
MSEPRKHHYVPQFYQRGFIADNTKKIWVYKKGVPPRHGSVRSNGMQIDLYAFSYSNGTVDFGSVENQLKLLDDHAAKLIQRIQKRGKLTDKDRKLLCRFVSVMWRRTPKHMNKVKETAKKLIPQVKKAVKCVGQTLNAVGGLRH